jgi:hypothetical protein
VRPDLNDHQDRGLLLLIALSLGTFIGAFVAFGIVAALFFAVGVLLGQFA